MRVRILTSFYDDTTLLWADKLRRALTGPDFVLSIIDESTSRSASELSAWQRALAAPFLATAPSDPFDDTDYLSQFDVVVTGKPSAELSQLLSVEPYIDTIVKLRSAPEENRGHVHQDLFPYTDLLADLPANLATSLDRAEQFLDANTLSFGCTTTVISEAIAHGAPTTCYLDYPEFPLDKLNLPMRRLLVGSNVVGSLDDIFDLRFRRPAEDWVVQNYRSDDFASFFEKLIAQL